MFPPSSRTRNWYEVLFEDPARFAAGSSDALKRESPGLNGLGVQLSVLWYVPAQKYKMVQ